jgi:hypothetical protein
MAVGDARWASCLTHFVFWLVTTSYNAHNTPQRAESVIPTAPETSKMALFGYPKWSENGLKIDFSGQRIFFFVSSCPDARISHTRNNQVHSNQANVQIPTEGWIFAFCAPWGAPQSFATSDFVNG